MDAYPCRLKKAYSKAAMPEITAGETEEKKDESEVPATQEEASKLEKEPLTVNNARAFLKELADADEALHAARERASHLAVLELERRLRKYPNLGGGQRFLSMFKTMFN